MQSSTIDRRQITSIHGQKTFWCKECQKDVPVAFHCKGQSPSPFTGETIYWDFINGECGHTSEDWSH